MKKFGLLFSVLLIAMILKGCKKSYSIHYHGQKHFYLNAKDSYVENELVQLIFPLTSPQIQYSFTLNDVPLNPKITQQGIMIEFVMPSEDISLLMISTHTETKEFEPVLIANYYEAVFTAEGKQTLEYTLETTIYPNQLKLTTFYPHESFEQMVSYDNYHQWTELAKQYQIDTWNPKKDMISSDGIKRVVKLIYQGQYVRITSEHMPDNGEEIFQQFKEIIKKTQ